MMEMTQTVGVPVQVVDNVFIGLGVSVFTTFSMLWY